jgi:hypothetical protein
MEHIENTGARAIIHKESRASSLAHASNVLSDWAERMIAEVPQMSDDKIIETARTACELERQAFRVRGACAAELKRRIRERLRLSPLNHEPEDAAVCKQMAKLASELGISPHTLNDDSRIFETFGDRFGVDTELTREHYRLALAAPNPHAAIEMAATKVAEQPNYTTRDFRHDVAQMNTGRPEKEVEELHWVSLGLDTEAWADLQVVKTRLGCDTLTAVSMALRALSNNGVVE